MIQPRASAIAPDKSSAYPLPALRVKHPFGLWARCNLLSELLLKMRTAVILGPYLPCSLANDTTSLAWPPG